MEVFEKGSHAARAVAATFLFEFKVRVMSRVIKRSVSQAVKSRGVPPQFIPPQLSQPVESAQSGQQWAHEIKLDGYRMGALAGHCFLAW